MKPKKKIVYWRRVLKAMGACPMVDHAWKLAGRPKTLDGMAEWIDRPENRFYRRQLLAFLNAWAMGEAWARLRREFYSSGPLSEDRSLGAHLDTIKSVFEENAHFMTDNPEYRLDPRRPKLIAYR